MDAGLQLTQLTEHDSVPWQAFPGQMEQTGDGEWRWYYGSGVTGSGLRGGTYRYAGPARAIKIRFREVSGEPWRLPLICTLQAVRHA